MPNAKVLESKKAVVEALSAKIQEATSVVFVDYKGISVAQDTELRKQFREAGVDYTVVKNTLTRFAAKQVGYVIPVVITVYSDRSFTFITKTPPVPVLIKNAAGIESGSAKPNRDKVAKLTKDQVREIATTKMPDLNAGSIEAAMSMVAGTARSMGVLVED